MKFVPRLAARRLRRLLHTFPCVLIRGPRQCGKSTLVKKLFPHWTHLDLERAGDEELLRHDTPAFFDRHPRDVVIDEAQRLPDLFTALRPILDASPRRGRFVLTGSAGPLLMRRVSESLAGRMGLLELSPFLARELVRRPEGKDRWFWGGFPPVHRLRGRTARGEWLDAWSTSFVERDLPAHGFHHEPRRLKLLLRMLTHVHGRLLNVSDIARSLQVSVTAVNNGLDILEDAFIIRRLPPYFVNIRKRLTRAPKVYIRDTGLLHRLAGLESPSELEAWPRRGDSFEGWVVEELAMICQDLKPQAELFFWRTQAGAEVDLLIRRGRRLLPIEIKSTSSPDAYSLRGVRQCMIDLNLPRGWIICTAPERRSARGGVDIVPWHDVVSGRWTPPL